MHKYTAMSVLLDVDSKYAAANGRRQFFICVRTTTKKRVAELLGGGHSSLRTLNEFNGLWINDDFSFDPPKDEEIYFHNEHLGTPNCGAWLPLSENRRKHENNIY